MRLLNGLVGVFLLFGNTPSFGVDLSRLYKKWSALDNTAILAEPDSGGIWLGGTGTMYVGGTFSGAEVSLFSCASVEEERVCYEIDPENCTLTAAGACNFWASTSRLAVTVSGGSNPSINVLVSGPTQASLNSSGGVVAVQPSFSDITSGTNALADMVVGSGAAILTSGTGNILGSYRESPNLVVSPQVGGRVNIRSDSGTEDLEIWHDGTSGNIRSTTGNLFISTSGSQVRLTLNSNNPIIQDVGTFGYEISGAGVFTRFAAGWGPNYNDKDTLMFSCGANCLGLKAGDVSVIEIATSSVKTLGCSNYGPQSAAPASPVACDMYFDTDLGSWCSYNGSEWFDLFTGLVNCS